MFSTHNSLFCLFQILKNDKIRADQDLRFCANGNSPFSRQGYKRCSLLKFLSSIRTRKPIKSPFDFSILVIIKHQPIYTIFY